MASCAEGDRPYLENTAKREHTTRHPWQLVWFLCEAGCRGSLQRGENELDVLPKESSMAPSILKSRWTYPHMRSNTSQLSYRNSLTSRDAWERGGTSEEMTWSLLSPG
jgi:hypothetical protein